MSKDNQKRIVSKCCGKCIKHPESDLVCKGFCPCHHKPFEPKEEVGEKCDRCGLPKSEWKGRWQDPICKVGGTSYELHKENCGDNCVLEKGHNNYCVNINYIPEEGSKDIEKEELIEKLAMAITHSEQGEYAKNERFVRDLLSQQEAKIKRKFMEKLENIMKGMSPILFFGDGKNHLSDVEKQKIVLENALSNIKKLLNE